MSKRANLPKTWTKQQKIEWYQDKITGYKVALAEVQSALKTLGNRRSGLLKKLNAANGAIYDLRHTENADNVPEITDHAIVRYLQRVKGMDMNELKLEIAKEKNIVKDGNVIITVLEDYSKEEPPVIK